MKTCKEHAVEWVHIYAASGAAWTVLPIPIATSAGLAAAETYMIYWIGKVYGEDLSAKEILAVAGGLELASIGLKSLAIEVCNFVPVIGWLIKPVIAASTIEAVGRLVVKHFEGRYPGRLFTAVDGLEEAARRNK